MEATASTLDIIFRQADMRFGSSLAATPTWYDQIATTIPSKSRQVTYGWMDRVPSLRKWVGPRVINAVATHARTVTNDVYELTDSLLKEDIEDDQFGLFNMNLTFMAAQAAKWPDQQLAQFIRDASTTLGFDGKAVYATDHPINGGGVSGGLSGTQSNLAVNTALTYENYVAARAAMTSFLGADNQPLSVVPDLLIVPPQLEGKAKNILEADLVAGVTAGGTSNVVTAAVSNVFKGTAKVLMIPEFADKPNNWWLACTTKPVKPFLWQLRDAPKFTYLVNPTDWNVFNSRQYLYGVEARGAAAETLWFLSYAATSGGSY